MWINYKRLSISGMNARTTSVGESLHLSMENGYDGVFALSSLHKFASKMMDKSERKGKEIEKYNAQELSRTQTCKNSERGEYLTDYAYKLIEKEYELLLSCRAIQISDDTYHVYTPDDRTKTIKIKLSQGFID